jgi:hypothetical protein
MAEQENSDQIKIKNLLDVYDRIFNLFKANNDNYLTRTQILMFAIQGAIFASLGKLVFDSIDTENISLIKLSNFILVAFISFFGFLASLVARQWKSLELFRCYMRYIERQLMDLHFPLACFRAETLVLKYNHFIKFESSNNCPDSEIPTIFPYNGRKVKFGLMSIEKYIAWFLSAFWFSCLFICLYYIVIERIRNWYLPRYDYLIYFLVSLLIVFFSGRFYSEVMENRPSPCNKTVTFLQLTNIEKYQPCKRMLWWQKLNGKKNVENRKDKSGENSCTS